MAAAPKTNQVITAFEAIEIVQEQLDYVILRLASMRDEACLKRVESSHLTIKNLLQDLREAGR
jgi:hypothetical protein